MCSYSWCSYLPTLVFATPAPLQEAYCSNTEEDVPGFLDAMQKAGLGLAADLDSVRLPPGATAKYVLAAKPWVFFRVPPRSHYLSCFVGGLFPFSRGSGSARA